MGRVLCSALCALCAIAVLCEVSNPPRPPLSFPPKLHLPPSLQPPPPPSHPPLPPTDPPTHPPTHPPANQPPSRPPARLHGAQYLETSGDVHMLDQLLPGAASARDARTDALAKAVASGALPGGDALPPG